MFATLSLDTSKFESGATEAITQSGNIEKAINSISTDNIDAEIAALDREIASLDAEIHDLEMANLDDDIKKSNKAISTLEKEISNMDKKAKIMENVIQTAVDIGTELITSAVEFLFDFAIDSLDFVAESGSAVGATFKAARDEFNLSVNVMKQKTGEALAPVVMKFYDLAEAMAGVTAQDKVDYMLSTLNNYKFENLENVKETLSGIFSEVDKWDPSKAEEVASVSDVTGNLQSQIQYWNEYNRVLSALKERGVDADIIGEYADGSKESLAKLQNIEKASDDELQALTSTYEELEKARTQAAETISAAQLDVDASVDEMINTIARLATEVSVDEPGQNVFDAAQGMVNSLSSQYPAISQWVDKINAKIMTLGTGIHYDSNGDMFGGGVGGIGSFAIGLDYVPADDFPALLHEGEAVLTKAEATEWRRGETTGSVDMGGLTTAITSAISSAFSNLKVYMDGEKVGDMVTDQVSRNLASAAWEERYST